VFQRSVINAEMFDPQGAMAAGFLDRIVAADQLMPTALEVARQMKKLNPVAHRATKLKARKALLEALDAAIEADKKASVVG
jgi:enoyl-CoA hydratase